jgi:hypothetical protein
MEYARSWEHQQRVLPEHEQLFWLIVASLALIDMVLICLTLYYHLLRVSKRKDEIKYHSAKNLKIWPRKRRLQNAVNIMTKITEEEEEYLAVSQIADDPTPMKSLSR